MKYLDDANHHIVKVMDKSRVLNSMTDIVVELFDATESETKEILASYTMEGYFKKEWDRLNNNN